MTTYVAVQISPDGVRTIGPFASGEEAEARAEGEDATHYSWIVTRLEGSAPEEGRESHVLIPGSVYATYEGGVDEGRITRLTFTPHAGGAGYFGPAAIADEAPNGLDTESTDGPFWTAVQGWLAVSGDGPSITWTE